jgi:hypothetical protein
MRDGSYADPLCAATSGCGHQRSLAADGSYEQGVATSGVERRSGFGRQEADDIGQMQAVTGGASPDDRRSALTSASDLVEEHWREVAPRDSG